MTLPSIHVSIVVGANEQLIFRCLRSLMRQRGSFQVSITVTTNPGSVWLVQRLREEYPGVELVVNPRRLGFAENHNRVLSASSSKYVLILNDDTELLDGALEALVQFMEAHEKCAVAGPRLLNPDHTV